MTDSLKKLGDCSRFLHPSSALNEPHVCPDWGDEEILRLPVTEV